VHEEGEWQVLYESVRDAEGGFPGIWAFWPDLAAAVELAVDDKHVEEYIDSVSWLIGEVVGVAKRERRLPTVYERGHIAAAYVRTFCD
jgi:hypothetical protein